MALAYIIVAFIIVIFNPDQLPAIISLIVRRVLLAGKRRLLAAWLIPSRRLCKRVLHADFSQNEAGMGSAANVAASASPNPNHPASQGFGTDDGVFADTIVICTATAAIILLSGDVGSSDDGIRLTINAMSSHVGDWAVRLLQWRFSYSALPPS